MGCPYQPLQRLLHHVCVLVHVFPSRHTSDGQQFQLDKCGLCWNFGCQWSQLAGVWKEIVYWAHPGKGCLKDHGRLSRGLTVSLFRSDGQRRRLKRSDIKWKVYLDATMLVPPPSPSDADGDLDWGLATRTSLRRTGIKCRH
jgi:hypothetical protein